MVVAGFLQVLRRYIFGAAFVWVEEISTFLLVWITFVGTAKAMALGVHTRIGVLLNHMTPKTQKWFQTILDIIVFCFFGFVGYFSIDTVKIGFLVKMAGFKVAKGWYYIALPIGCILTMVILVCNIIERFKSTKGGGTD